jgi:dethiobiotin synthetase
MKTIPSAALEHYLQAQGKTVDYARVTNICRSYLSRLAAAFDGINMCLNDEIPAVFHAAVAPNLASATVCGA